MLSATETERMKKYLDVFGDRESSPDLVPERPEVVAPVAITVRIELNIFVLWADGRTSKKKRRKLSPIRYPADGLSRPS
jgi:hypothetical protein